MKTVVVIGMLLSIGVVGLVIYDVASEPVLRLPQGQAPSSRPTTPPGAKQEHKPTKPTTSIPTNGVRYEDDMSLPPPSPGELEGQLRTQSVMLQWTPVELEIIRGYNVYREEQESPSLSVKKIGFTEKHWYEDKTIRGGTTYIYSVASVDVYGNQSDLSETVSMRIPADKKSLNPLQ